MVVIINQQQQRSRWFWKSVCRQLRQLTHSINHNNNNNNRHAQAGILFFLFIV